MALKLYTGPTVEPVTLEEAKLHLRVDDPSTSSGADDNVIRDLITAARLDIETLSMHALITQTWDLYLDAFPGSEIQLPMPPVQSVTGVYYTPDSTGVEATVTSTYYRTDIISYPPRVVLKSDYSWPGDALIEVNGVKVRFVAGFGDDPSDVDQRLRQAVLLLVGHYYENREAIYTGRTKPELLPMGVSGLVWEYRAKMVKF
jgi:uncharacterized phiE125 gp8 family phage protein